MKILKIIAALFMLLVLVACSKPDPLVEAKKNGFSSIAEMNEMKFLGHSTKMGYLLSILPSSGCSSIEELEHALSETGGSCDYWRKYVHTSTPLKGFKGKSIFLSNTKILNLISGGDSLDGLALNVSHCAVINYFAYQSYSNGTLLDNEGGIDEEAIVGTKNNYLFSKTFFQSLNSNVDFEETGQYFYRTILDNIQDIKNTQGDQNAVKAALKIVKQGSVICAQYLISDSVKSLLSESSSK